MPEMDLPVHRTGGPRPKRDQVLTLKLTAEGMSAIDALAEKEGRSRSDMVRVLLQRGMDAPL